MKKLAIAFILMVQSAIFSAHADEAVASWYGPGFHLKRTASGEIFNQNAYTTAHNSLPFGTIVKVTYNEESVNVRVNDTGGFKKYGRQFDLSKGAAWAIGCKGVCRIKYEILSHPKRSVYYKNRPNPM